MFAVYEKKILEKNLIEDTDFETIHRIQNGNTNAFNDLIEKYSEKIRNLVYLILNDRNSVDDITQDIFLKIYESINSFRFESSFYTWIYRITTNKCRDEIRKKRIRKFVSLEYFSNFDNEIMQKNDQFNELDNNMIINEALSKLSFSQREIIILKDIEDLSYEEISINLGCEIGTVKSRLARARLSLAKIVRKMMGVNYAKI